MNERWLLRVSSRVSPRPFHSIAAWTVWGWPAAARDVTPTLGLILPTSCEAQGARAAARGIPLHWDPQNPSATPGQEKGEAAHCPARSCPRIILICAHTLFPSFHDKRLSGGCGGKIIPSGAEGMLY